MLSTLKLSDSTNMVLSLSQTVLKNENDRAQLKGPRRQERPGLSLHSQTEEVHLRALGPSSCALNPELNEYQVKNSRNLNIKESKSPEKKDYFSNAGRRNQRKGYKKECKQLEKPILTYSSNEKAKP